MKVKYEADDGEWYAEGCQSIFLSTLDEASREALLKAARELEAL